MANKATEKGKELKSSFASLERLSTPDLKKLMNQRQDELHAAIRARFQIMANIMYLEECILKAKIRQVAEK